MADDKPQPENHGAWANATKSLLGNAKSVTDELFAALKDKDIAAPHNPKVPVIYVNPGPKNKADLDHKLSISRFAVNTVDTAVQRSHQAVLRLRHEGQKKWAPLQVCEWRLKLRARRPPRELFQDHVTDALQKEHQVLMEAREKVQKLAEEGKAFAQECEANKIRLNHIIRLMVFQGTANLTPEMLQQPQTPASPSSSSNSPPDAAAPPAEGEEAAPAAVKADIPSSHEGLLKRAPQLIEKADAYGKKADDLIKRHREICRQALESVTQCFKKRWGENDSVRKELEAQIHQMDAAIEDAEKALAAMKKRIDHYGEVDKQVKYDAAQAALVKLIEAKEHLEDDLHHKLVSMKIDESCRKITTERAAGVPPEQLPILAMLESKKKNKKGGLNRTSSSPAFVGATGAARPGSPAGASSPLKAAGGGIVA